MNLEEVISVKFDFTRDDRGFLGYWENGPSKNFQVKRFYWIVDFKKSTLRGVHAHKQLKQILLPLNGSIQILLDDGIRKKTVILDVGNKTGLFIPNGIWRELVSLSDDAALAVLADSKYDADDYIYNYQDFLEWKLKS